MFCATRTTSYASSTQLSMSTRTLTLALLVGTAFASIAPLANAQIILQVDQAKPASVTIASPTSGRPVVDSVESGTFRLRRPADVQVRVVNTNTALYTITTEEKETPALSELQSVRDFLPNIKPYLPELGLVVPASNRGLRGTGRTSMLPSIAPSSSTAVQAALENGRVVEDNLHQLDELVHGSRGIDGVFGLTQRTVGRMRAGQVEAQAKAFVDSLGLPDQSCTDAGSSTRTSRGAQDTSLNLANNILATLSALQPASAALGASLGDNIFGQDPTLGGFHTQLSSLQARADTALHDSDNIVAAASHLEKTVTTVAGACSHWESRPVSVGAGAGRVVTVNIEPRPEPELQRAATQKATTVNITLLAPPRVLGVSLGPSALYAPHAQYPTYSVRPTGGAGSANEIYESDPIDARFSYGVTLGVSWHPRLDWPGIAQTAFWLPNLTVAETGGHNSVAFGGGISFGRFVMIGGGATIVRHDVLVGDTVAQHVPNAQFLSKKPTYGRPTPYLSITLFHFEELFGGPGDGGGVTPHPTQPEPAKATKK